MKSLQKEQLQTAIEKSWIRETSSVPDEWSEELASRGQCVPTALVVQDYLGGELQNIEVNRLMDSVDWYMDYGNKAMLAAKQLLPLRQQ